MLKDASVIDGPDISISWCRLEFRDRGPSADPFLRQAHAGYASPEFTNLTGISGAPVFSANTGKLRGMVVRGGTDGKLWTIHYIDVFDIIVLLEAVVAGHDAADYAKSIPPTRF
jgi:hypothetical protein